MKSIQSDLPEQVLLKFFSSENISFSSDTVFAVCFSGGRDSTALLLMMNDLARKYAFSLKAVYVRHNLRPQAECDNEENHVGIFCRNENIPFRTETIPPGFISGTAAEENRSVEEVARTERYRIFGNLYDQGWADWFLTAHHLDDNFETVLFRIFQGAGISGVKGIPSRSGCFLRPLLSVPGGILHDYLKKKSVNWFTDSTNNDLSFLRNRYRNLILPFLQKEIPGLSSGLNRFIRKMKEADQIISASDNLSCLMPGDIVKIQRDKWDNLSEWEKTESLYKALQTVLNEDDRSRISFDFLCELKTGSGEKFYRGVRIRIDSDFIIFLRPGEDSFRTDFCIDISLPGQYRFPGGTLKVGISSEPDPESDLTFPAEVVFPPVFFRSLRLGDDRSKMNRCFCSKKNFPGCCIGDRNGLLAVFEDGQRFRKKNADLEKNRFFNYYIS